MCFTNNFGGYKKDMPEKLQRFMTLLGTEKDEDDAGEKAAKKIAAELKLRRDDIPDFSVFNDTDNRLGLAQLNQYLFSTEHNPPIGDQVHHDMNAPLSHYFIHTSLKSYFTGSQFLERYSNEPIIDALKQGVRVVELDLRPCGKDGICVSGHRWNSKNPLKLETCLDSIKDHAFTPGRSYPVIITFKDGLTQDLQSKATQMINEIFGNMVYYHDPHRLGEFPSPSDLRNKILISRRPPKELLFANDDDQTVVVQNGNETQQEAADQNYQSLVAFHAVEPSGMLLQALTTDKVIQRPGWYETDVISFTQKRFLRTRPKKGKLIMNAPYKPQRAWMHGAQMIALSRQEDKEKLWLMQGMFRANGGCGYVKKPDFLLNASPGGVFYPTVNPEVKKTLKVKVYMGDGWSKDFKKLGRLTKPELYVLISIAGVPHDEKIKRTTVKSNEWPMSKKEKTEKKNREWIPTWGEEFTFPLTYPDLALLNIQVYDHEIAADGFGGQTCLPVSELKEGIRAVPLYDEKGERCSSTMLLMRFRFSTN
ncbi:phosphoinositide phospholipase C 8 [Eutrema salsugineum]|nr:phosphoinositide phospholipase C 8 [Eutrema salsugineum]